MEILTACSALCLAREADGLSPETLNIYRWGLKKMAVFISKEIDEITKDDLVNWFVSLRKSGLSESSVHIAWRAMRALFRWALEEKKIKTRPDLSIRKPVVPEPEVHPFSNEEVKRMLVACKFMAEAKTKNRKTFVMQRHTEKRDRALVLFLLDTGLRASECGRIRYENIDLRECTAEVKPFRSGKKSKPRTVYFSRSTAKALASYVNGFSNIKKTDPLFMTEDYHTMQRDAILKLIVRLGQRANVENAHPHRFRHTFAIQFLRNGGDIFTLQRILGHSSLKMVKKYLEIADSDAANAHRRASPVDNWRL
jgi:integrase/recombinase XerD